MNTIRKVKGPWTLRFLALLFTVLVGLLVFWLLGFALRDIGTLPPPAFDAVEQRHLDPSARDKKTDLERQVADLKRRISGQQERQRLLRDSINSAQTTLNQLLDIQRLGLQKGLAPTEAQQKAFSESQDLFLTNQQRYQSLNDDVTRWSEELRGLEDNLRQVDESLTQQRANAQQEYARIRRRHDLKLAALKLAVLIPILLVVVWCFFRQRRGLYTPFIYATGIAVLWKVGLVIHEHFPSKFFKYILLLVALGIISQLLVYLLRNLACPKKDALLKQYREAYEKFLCPICSFPIRRGPLKFMIWNRRSLRKFNVPPATASATDEAYSCPACGARVYEECAACKAIRHAYLPACEHCGAEKELASPPAAEPAG